MKYSKEQSLLGQKGHSLYSFIMHKSNKVGFIIKSGY